MMESHKMMESHHQCLCTFIEIPCINKYMSIDVTQSHEIIRATYDPNKSIFKKIYKDQKINFLIEQYSHCRKGSKTIFNKCSHKVGRFRIAMV